MDKCSKHKSIVSELGYIQSAEEAERRIGEGQVQKQCPDCKLYFFPDEYGEGWEPDSFTNVPERIFLSPTIEDDVMGEIDFSTHDHEYTYWGETRNSPSDIEYVLASQSENRIKELEELLILANNVLMYSKDRPQMASDNYYDKKEAYNQKYNVTI